jgi:cytochrome P450
MIFDEPGLLQNPYPHYQKWREERPIWWAEDINAWVLSRYDDVRTVLKNAEHFSSKSMGEMEHQAIALPLLTDDAPRHTQLRSIVSKAFTSRTLKKMEAEVEVLVDQLLEDMAGRSTIDIAAEFTIPLPVSLISRLMGIPEQRSDDFKRWSDALVSTGQATEIQDRMPDIMEMAGYFQSLIAERRENPGDDLVSQVVNAEVDGQSMNDQDIVGFCMLLLIAGNETTSSLLSNLLDYLANDTDTWDALREDPSKIDAAVEEALRFDAPVQWTNRKATVDTEFHGQTVKAGDVVYVLMGSANHDPDHYANPNEFRLDRPRPDHHSLGYGVHFCIGAPLARMEARYALKGILSRFKSISHVSSENNERTYSNMLRGYHHLWLQLD